MDKYLITADIGGTTSRFASFVVTDAREVKLLQVQRFGTRDFEDFHHLLDHVRSEKFEPGFDEAALCVFAVAGAVRRGVYCAPPNIDWDIDLSAESSAFGMHRFVLINDFLAQAFASISHLASAALQVQSGTPEPDSGIGVIGPGTGLGKAFLVPVQRGMYVGAPSEGGHTNFCAEDEEELRYARFVMDREGGNYASWDAIVSGRGLSYLHEFLMGEKLTPEQVASRFTDSSPVLGRFARFLGRVCRNFALETLALGGVFIVGGVAAKNPLLVKHPEFRAAFRSSSPYHDMLSKIPVSLIQDQDSGLWGAAYYGLNSLSLPAPAPEH